MGDRYLREELDKIDNNVHLSKVISDNKVYVECPYVQPVIEQFWQYKFKRYHDAEEEGVRLLNLDISNVTDVSLVNKWIKTILCLNQSLLNRSFICPFYARHKRIYTDEQPL